MNFLVWLGLGVLAFTLLAFPSPNRVHNFSAGPAQLPFAAVKEAHDEFFNYKGFGSSIFELSHRDHDGPVQNMMVDAATRLRRFMQVPETHEILYMHGGAHGQFAAVPLNLCREGQTAQYVTTGFWSNRAADEGAKQTKINKIPGTRDGKLLTSRDWKVPANSCFVHICASETIDGVEYLDDSYFSSADLAGVPLVGDFTSTLLSRPIDWSKFGVIYASGGKNLGPSGFVVVIVRKTLLDRAQQSTPSILNWKIHAETQPISSIYNTPSTWNVYMHGLVMKSYEEAGGMPAVAGNVKQRANAVYSLIDNSNYYFNAIEKPYRSVMSIPLLIQHNGKRHRKLEELFVKEATAQGMTQLFGHPVRGGLRVTLYHGVSNEAVSTLLKFMKSFQQRHPLE